MSDDSDRAASPGRRAKRLRGELGNSPPPILAFDTLGPEETTADLSLGGESGSKGSSPEPGTGPIIQTTEDIGRLQMENVRLRVELDELRKQLYALQQAQHDQQRPAPAERSRPSANPDESEARIRDLEQVLVFFREENRRLAEQGRDSPAADTRDAQTDHSADGGKAERETVALRRTVQEMQDRLKDLQQTNEALVDDNKGLKQANEDIRTGNEDLKRNSEDLKREISEAQMRAASTGSEVQRLQALVQEMQDRAERTESSTGTHDELKARVESLSRELDAARVLQSRAQELEETNAALKAALEREQERLLSFQHSSDADARLNTENEELKDMLVDLGTKDHERAHELQVLAESKDTLSSKLEETEGDLAKVQAEGQKQAEKITSLETDLKTASLQLTDATHRLTMLEESLELKDTQNTELRDEVHRLTIRDKEQTEAVQHLGMQQSHLQRLNEDFKQRVTSQDASITEQRAEIRDLHRQCTDQAESLEEAQRLYRELEVLAQSRARSLEDRERQVKELTQTVEQLQTTVSQLEESVATKSRLAEQQAEAAWLQKRAAEEEINRLRAEHAHEVEVLNHEHNEALANQLDKQQRIVEDVKRREVAASEKHDKQLQALRAQVASLRAEAATSESEHNTEKALLDDTRVQLSQTLRALEDLQARSTEERSRYTSEKHRLERQAGELEARSSRLQTELDELRRKDKAVDERVQKLEQTLVDQSVELRQLKTPPASDAASSQDPTTEADTLRREFATQSTLWERMRDEMVDYINRMNGENSTLRAELERWRNEEAQRAQAMEDSLKRKFIKQAEQLESLASFKEDAQNSLVSVAQEDVRKLTQDNLAMRREQSALYERAESLELRANQFSAELTRAGERLSEVAGQLQVSQAEGERQRAELRHANELVTQSQARIADLESEVATLGKDREHKLEELRDQLEQARTALQASEATAKNLKINSEMLESQLRSQAETAVKYVDMLFFIMKVDRRRIQDLTFVKKHLMLYFPPPVGVFPIKGDNSGGTRRSQRTLYDIAIFALAVVRIRRGQRNGSRVLALEYEKQLRTMQ